MTATSTEAFRKPPLLRQLTTVAAGASGSALFLWLAVPGGGISGAMLVVTLMTVFGIAVRIEGGLRTIAMVASGVTLGAAVTPETLRGIATYPGSLAIMAVGVAATTLAPSGLIECDGRRYEAFARSGHVPAGSAVEVVGFDTFRVIVTLSTNPNSSQPTPS